MAAQYTGMYIVVPAEIAPKILGEGGLPAEGYRCSLRSQVPAHRNRDEALRAYKRCQHSRRHSLLEIVTLPPGVTMTSWNGGLKLETPHLPAQYMARVQRAHSERVIAQRSRGAVSLAQPSNFGLDDVRSHLVLSKADQQQLETARKKVDMLVRDVIAPVAGHEAPAARREGRGSEQERIRSTKQLRDLKVQGEQREKWFQRHEKEGYKRELRWSPTHNKKVTMLVHPKTGEVLEKEPDHLLALQLIKSAINSNMRGAKITDDYIDRLEDALNDGNLRMINARSNWESGIVLGSALRKYEKKDLFLSSGENAELARQEKCFNRRTAEGKFSETPGAWNAIDKLFRDVGIGNAWNRFQSQHQEKFTQAEMLSEYKRYSSRYDGTPQSSQGGGSTRNSARSGPGAQWRNDTSCSGGKENGRGGDKWTSCKGMSWNEFQSSMGGQHHSSPQIRDAYHEYKRTGSVATPTAPVPARSSSIPSNPWNAHQKSMGGQGYSRPEIQAGYHSTTPTAQVSAPRAEIHASYISSGSGIGGGASISASSGSGGGGGGGGGHGMSWNGFQSSMGGQGYSSSQIQAAYHAGK